MQKFLINPITDYAGRKYWVVNYPGNRSPTSCKPARRIQKKFNSLEKAQAFLEEAKREWIRKGGVKLAYDREAHYDFMRTMEVLAGIPNATLEKAVLIFVRCRSAQELRGRGYQAPKNRQIELSPRFFMMADNEAKKRGLSVGEAVEGVLAGWAEVEADWEIRERMRDEAREHRELLERNQKANETLVQIEKEDRLMELMGKQSAAYEHGRQSILMARNRYMREWRRKKRKGSE
jgi:hypothetical protein